MESLTGQTAEAEPSLPPQYHRVEHENQSREMLLCSSYAQCPFWDNRAGRQDLEQLHRTGRGVWGHKRKPSETRGSRFKTPIAEANTHQSTFSCSGEVAGCPAITRFHPKYLVNKNQLNFGTSTGFYSCLKCSVLPANTDNPLSSILLCNIFMSAQLVTWSLWPGVAMAPTEGNEVKLNTIN